MVIYVSLDLINSLSIVANTALLQPSNNSSHGAVSLDRLELEKQFKYYYMSHTTSHTTLRHLKTIPRNLVFFGVNKPT